MKKNNGKKSKASSKELKKVAYTEPQKLLIIQWLAEGLTTAEINELAASSKPPFVVTASELSYYRLTRDLDIVSVKKARESEAFNTGFALRENRVFALNKLARKMFEELDEGDKLWLANAKGIGSGPDFMFYEYEEFNKAELDAFRSVLADLAAEYGQRVSRHDLTTKDRPLTGGVISSETLMKELTDDELEILERAAAILNRGRDEGSSSSSD